MNVRINLKKPDHNYPYYRLAGRHLTIPVTTRRNIPWVELFFLTLRNSRLQYAGQSHSFITAQFCNFWHRHFQPINKCIPLFITHAAVNKARQPEDSLARPHKLWQKWWYRRNGYKYLYGPEILLKGIPTIVAYSRNRISLVCVLTFY